ncbi:MAG: hypothetical protein JWM58_4521 [Rhizobium sp.]|nr:hypothetical protein [Rhizobium sp.]
MTVDELEGRLSAQREILISVLAALLSGGPNTLNAKLKDETIFMDGEEDPGVVPSEAYAFEAARAAEIRSILGAAKARVAAEKKSSV